MPTLYEIGQQHNVRKVTKLLQLHDKNRRLPLVSADDWPFFKSKTANLANKTVDFLLSQHKDHQMKFKIERILALLLVSGILALISTGCSTVNTALMRGDSLADLKLRRNVYDAIKSYEKDCYGKSIGRGLGWYNNPTFCHIQFADTKVVEPKTNPQSPWKEVWVVQRDGVYASYTIQFYSDEKGGTAFNITFPPDLRDGPQQ